VKEDNSQLRTAVARVLGRETDETACPERPPMLFDEPAPAEIEGAILREARDVPIEQAHQIAETRVADRQIVERRVGGVASIAMRAAPAAAGDIFDRERANRLFQFRDQRRRAEIGFVEAGGEERAAGHRSALADRKRAPQAAATCGKTDRDFRKLVADSRYPPAPWTPNSPSRSTACGD
jgi:hypothetical protein